MHNYDKFIACEERLWPLIRTYGNRNYWKIERNLTSSSGKCHAMSVIKRSSDWRKENQFHQMLKQSSIMIFSENSVLVIQLEQHEEFLTFQLPLSTAQLVGLFARKFSNQYHLHVVSDLVFQWHFWLVFERLNPKLQRNRSMLVQMCATLSVHSSECSQWLKEIWQALTVHWHRDKMETFFKRKSEILKGFSFQNWNKCIAHLPSTRQFNFIWTRDRKYRESPRFFDSSELLDSAPDNKSWLKSHCRFWTPRGEVLFSLVYYRWIKRGFFSSLV